MSTQVDKNEIIAKVQECLTAERPAELLFDPEIRPEGVRSEEDWWYITITAPDDPATRHLFYQMLARAERKIGDGADLKVVFVPVGGAEQATGT